MLIITIRTDKPEAELGLFDENGQLAYRTWLAHRELAETIHAKIRDVLREQQRSLADISGVVAYKGPGSFTGLRIGLAVANTLAYALDVPIVGETGGSWAENGIRNLVANKGTTIALPEYGAAPHITAQKH